MSQPLVTIITPTYNKPTFFAECAESVLAQTFTDWVWWVVVNAWSWPSGYAGRFFNDPRVLTIWCPITEQRRSEVHVPAEIVNWLYHKVTTPYIYFLADDDLIDAEGLYVLVDAMRKSERISHPRYGVWWKETQLDAVYGRCEVLDEQPDGTFAHACWCYDAGDVGLGTGINPHCLLDGGQVLHTKALWDKATADSWTLNTSKSDAAANDGTLLNRLAQFARFHYVPQRIVTHRRTHLSTFHKPQTK